MRLRRISRYLVALLLLLLVGCNTATRAIAPAPVSQPQAPTPPAQTAPKASPGQPAYQAALELLRQQKLGEAVTKLQEAVKLDPNLADAWNDLSYASVRAQAKFGHVGPPNHPEQFTDAIAAAQKALALRPDWDHALYNLGVAELASLDYAKAIPPLRRSADLQPDRPEPLVALGLALIGNGQANEALAPCRQAEAMQTPFLLGRQCLQLLGDGLTRVPEQEGAVGWHQVLPAGKALPAPAKPPEGTWQRVSPNWTCAEQYAEGYRIAYFDCMDPVTYAFGFTRPEAGTTPAGVGVGTPWEAVTKAYGDTPYYDDALHYTIGNMELRFWGSELKGVERINFFHMTPIFAIEDLVHDQTNARPLDARRDGRLLGVALDISPTDVSTPLPDVDKAFGPPSQVTPGAGSETRIYRGGQLTLVAAGGKIQALELAQHGVSYRGIALGDPVARVKRLYGPPTSESAASVVYQNKQPPFSLTFRLTDGKVTAIRLEAAH